jgi:sugar phosphate permease
LGGAVLLISGIVYQFVRSNPEQKGLRQVGEEQSDAVRPDSSDAEKTPSPKWADTIKGVVKEGSVWYLGLVYFFYGLSYIIYMVFFAAYLVKEMGFSQEWDDLGEDIRFAWKKPGGSTGLPCAGAFLHYLCAD